MSVRLITLTIVGFLLGAFAAGGVGVRVIREVRSVDDATSLPAQNIARSDGYHVDPGETLISSVALVPTDVSIVDQGLVIAYDLISLAPQPDDPTPPSGPVLYPRSWLAEALGGEFEGTQSSPDDQVVSFPLLSGGTMEQVDTVKVVEALLPIPFEVRASVGTETPTITPTDGVTVELVDVADRDDTTVIELRVTTEGSLARNIAVVGDGSGWYPAVSEGDSVFLTRANQVDPDDEGVDPGSFDVVVSGTTWTVLDGEFSVVLGGDDE